ncbi:MAG: (deoxy)nucleoside triphosphate pyrophosphohydrolase [Microbacteriaceae bacterium]|nr:(deoxy)nucleoside triphosphate pyrophosphohydrolase [Microbacteriaceae bacterium]
MRHYNVVGAVIVQNGKIMAARRGTQMSQPGKWEFPGGKIEPGETTEQALVRELREEMRCDVRVGAKINTHTEHYDFGTVTLSCFYCELANNSAQPTLLEHSEIRWLNPHNSAALLALDWAAADIPAVHQIIADFAN